MYFIVQAFFSLSMCFFLCILHVNCFMMYKGAAATCFHNVCTLASSSSSSFFFFWQSVHIGKVPACQNDGKKPVVSPKLKLTKCLRVMACTTKIMLRA